VMNLIDSFTTDRLAAERLRADHFENLCRMDGDARVMATLNGVRTAEQTRKYLDTNLAHWDRHGFGLWVFRDRADGRYAGRGGLRHVAVEGRDEVEVSYALMPDFWGRGLATEIARASVAIAFGPLGLAELVCFTLPTNRASQRVMVKAGFRYEGDITHAGLPHVL